MHLQPSEESYTARLKPFSVITFYYIYHLL